MKVSLPVRLFASYAVVVAVGAAARLPDRSGCSPRACSTTRWA